MVSKTKLVSQEPRGGIPGLQFPHPRYPRVHQTDGSSAMNYVAFDWTRSKLEGGRYGQKSGDYLARGSQQSWVVV